MEKHEINRDGDTQSAITAGVTIGANAAILSETNGRAAVLPQGMQVHDLSAFLERPAYAIRRSRLHTADSFTSYVLAFKTETTVVFANINDGKIVAHIDYHAPNGPAAWLGHTAEFEIRDSREWSLWTSGRVFSQKAFSEFLQENAHNVLTPDAAHMLEVARDVRGKRSVRFGSAVNLSNGDVEIQFEQETATGTTRGSLMIPETFTIAVPVIEGGDPVEVECFLRYTVSDQGQISFTVHVPLKTKIRTDAVDEVAEEISESLGASGVVVYCGE